MHASRPQVRRWRSAMSSTLPPAPPLPPPSPPSRKPAGYWRSAENQRAWLDAFRVSRGLSVRELGAVPVADVRGAGGAALLDRHHGGSLRSALRTAYPEEDWLESSFPRVGRGAWQSREAVRGWLEGYARSKGLQGPEDWYGVRRKDLVASAGSGPLSGTGVAGVRSMRALLAWAYPEHQWQPWRFQPTPTELWEDEVTVRAYLVWLEAQLGITQPEDWYRVSYEQVQRLHGGALLTRHGGLAPLLRHWRPEHADLWRPEHFLPTALLKKTQRALVAAMRSLFPRTEVQEDAKPPGLRFPSGQAMEVDVWLPELHLALEYQGQHHYRDHYLFGAHSVAEVRDRVKAAACRAQGLDLVPVPYWWDGRLRSLAATLRLTRPHLLPDWAHLTAADAIPFLEPTQAPSQPALEGRARLVRVLPEGQLLLALPSGVEFHCDANGETNLPPDAECTYTFSGLHVQGRPQGARLRSAVAWTPLPRQGAQEPWYLTCGRARGRQPVCRGCGGNFLSRHEARLAVNASHIPGADATPLAATYYFHLRPGCVARAVEQDTLQLYPAWGGKALVFQEQHPLLTEEVRRDAQGAGVELIVEDKAAPRSPRSLRR